jgi:hypothetical protein
LTSSPSSQSLRIPFSSLSASWTVTKYRGLRSNRGARKSVHAYVSGKYIQRTIYQSIFTV